MPDHPFGSAADQDIGDDTLAVGAHDDEITILFFCLQISMMKVNGSIFIFQMDSKEREFELRKLYVEILVELWLLLVSMLLSHSTMLLEHVNERIIFQIDS